MTYLSLTTIGRLDVIHNVDVDIVQDHAALREAWTFPEDTSEDDTCLGRGDFDGGFYTLEAMRGDGVDGRTLDEFEVSQGSEIEAEVLEGVGCLVHEEYV
jgi:hypothetical protein